MLGSSSEVTDDYLKFKVMKLRRKRRLPSVFFQNERLWAYPKSTQGLELQHANAVKLSIYIGLTDTHLFTRPIRGLKKARNNAW